MAFGNIAIFIFISKRGISTLSDGNTNKKGGYGDMDERIAELLPEHIELKRENAMCKGDGWCDFLYYRK
jgi:hypothetical protein